MKYEVGQIIYLLLNSEMKIVPVRVEEEVIRRRAGSEVTNYKVLLPMKDKHVVDLAELDATPFVSPAELRSHMIENAVKTVDTMIERAARMSRNLVATPPEQEQEPVRDEESEVE